MDLEKMKLFDRIEPMIGGTPLLEIQFKFKGTKRRIFAKMESYNLTGNIKDRGIPFFMSQIVPSRSKNTAALFKVISSFCKILSYPYFLSNYNILGFICALHNMW